MPFSVREGINVFLDGFIPTENLRFREESLNFRLAQDTDEEIKVRLRMALLMKFHFFSAQASINILY